MIIKNINIHSHTKESFQIDANKELYYEIIEDMLAHAGNFVPRSVWQKLDDCADSSTYKDGADRYKEEILSYEEREEYAKALLLRYPTLASLLDAWVGPTGRRENFDPTVMEQYANYLKDFDREGLFEALIENTSYKIFTDVTTVEEVCVLHTEAQHFSSLDILEVGGGYGRLCEGVMNVFCGQVKYLLADSVPISLMYCYLYLKKNLPDCRVGIYYLDSNPNLNDYDCFIVPTWYLEAVCIKNKKQFDVSINIQSMQEMSQWHVDYYLEFFNVYGKEDSLIYLNNNKRYIFTGEWNYPKNWQLLLRHPTPRTWSIDCPTEVFQKRNKDYSKINNLTNSLYRRYNEMKNLFDKKEKEMQVAKSLLEDCNISKNQMKDRINSLEIEEKHLQEIVKNLEERVLILELNEEKLDTIENEN